MKGWIEWVGIVECNTCSETAQDIKWGEGRNTLRRLGWKQYMEKGLRRWYCPKCRIERAM